VPVVFLETGKHFPETLAYRDALAKTIGLTNIINVMPDPETLPRRTKRGCAGLTIPMGAAKSARSFRSPRRSRPYRCAIYRAQGLPVRHARQACRAFEVEEGRLKVNPLADWDKDRIEAYLDKPMPCPGIRWLNRATSRSAARPAPAVVKPGEDPRSGRWRGWDKVECGIHTAVPGADDPANDPVF
jgi:phosphoadenosine phosphosulfate reductase